MRRRAQKVTPPDSLTPGSRVSVYGNGARGTVVKLTTHYADVEWALTGALHRIDRARLRHLADDAPLPDRLPAYRVTEDER